MSSPHSEVREDEILGPTLRKSRIYLALWSSVVACAVWAGAAPAVAAPPHCGSHVTRDVTLHADLTGCGAFGLIIAADGVTVDLNGFAITGHLGAGIDNTAGHDRVTVKSSGGRGGLAGGVAIAHGDDNVVRNLDADELVVRNSSGGVLANNRLIRGVHLDHAHQVRVVDNTIAGISTSTLDVSHSSRIVLRGNTVSQGHRGIFFSKTEHSRIVSNEVKLADEPAIWLTHRSNHNVVAKNRVRGSLFQAGGDGIGVQVSSGNRIAQNVILKASQGIIIGSPDPFLADNFGRGISRGNVVSRNIVRRAGAGIRAAQDSSADTRIKQNTAKLGGQGIRAGSPSTALADNLVKENEGYGISAVRGVENLGGNVAIRNMGRPQCVHVHCRTIPPGT